MSRGQVIAQQQLILAIGRIERALSRIEQVPRLVEKTGNDDALRAKHEHLKTETRAVIANLDQLISGQAQ